MLKFDIGSCVTEVLMASIVGERNCFIIWVTYQSFHGGIFVAQMRAYLRWEMITVPYHGDHSKQANMLRMTKGRYLYKSATISQVVNHMLSEYRCVYAITSAHHRDVSDYKKK